ncbi:MAG: plasmid maintenance system killer [Chloroflexi bacterium RBG_16_52_11]|nr:MAG: plasmid maintenance system killer [Chloroflexi bacterium RBG_16_52_11]
MRFSFKRKKLEDLYYEEKGAQKYPPEVINAFFHVMSIIDAIPDIRDLYQLKSLHFEKLKGKRKDERSVRLNKQFRLTMQLEVDDEGNYLLILDIEDYHD